MARGLGDRLTLVSVAVVAPPPLWDIPQESTPRLPSLVGPSVCSFVRSLHALRLVPPTLPFNRFSAKLPPRKRWPNRFSSPFPPLFEETLD